MKILNEVKLSWPECKRKMSDFDCGLRKENVRACSDEKLQFYYDICKSEGYRSAGYKIESEMLTRGLVSPYDTYFRTPMQRPAKFTGTIDFTENDFQPVDGFFIYEHSSDNPVAGKADLASIVSDLEKDLANDTVNLTKQLFLYLVWAICLKLTQAIEILKAAVAKQGMSNKDIYDTIQNILQNKTIVTRIQENIEYIKKNAGISEELEETIEKHDKLNPKLFGADNKLLPQVVDKINEIVEEFKDELAEEQVELVVKDIVLIGSNVSFNYTKDSDLDVHIVTNMEGKSADYGKIYDAYRKLWNRRMSINFYGIPVELYVESSDLKTVSNGIYSVLNNDWIKFPTEQVIPEVDQNAVDHYFKPFEDWYNDIKANPTIEEIDKFINDVYVARQTALEGEGEYALGNLVFKEVRNYGYLDDLKELRNEVRAKELSLEEEQKALEEDIQFENLIGEILNLLKEVSFDVNNNEEDIEQALDTVIVNFGLDRQKLRQMIDSKNSEDKKYWTLLVKLIDGELKSM